jgi:hypothetical protein
MSDEVIGEYWVAECVRSYGTDYKPCEPRFFPLTARSSTQHQLYSTERRARSATGIIVNDDRARVFKVRLVRIADASSNSSPQPTETLGGTE